jgi:short-subunit dehydrogenase
MTEPRGLLADLNFARRRVLITGAANGFGAAIAARFAEHGATLVLADIEEAPLAAISARLGAQAHTFDQSDPGAVQRLAEAAGEIDILINNAGILIAKPLLETSLQDVRRLIDTDLVGVIRLIQLIGGGMVARRRGVILSIGSQTAFAGGENRAVYAAAKAAISQLTRAAAARLAMSPARP